MAMVPLALGDVPRPLGHDAFRGHRAQVWSPQKAFLLACCLRC